jgi:hypothetical protein
MMGRLRSTMQMLGAAAAVICVLSLAGLSPARAVPSNLSGADAVSPQPCNHFCKAYLAWSGRVSAMWSDRVSAMFHRPRPVARTAVHHVKLAGRMVVHHRVSRTREPSLNSFAQFPVRRDAMPQPAETPQAADTSQSAETSQAEDASSRPVEPVADRVPAADGFVTASLAGSTSGATNDAPENTVASVTDAIPATQGTSKIDDTAGGLHIRFALPLLLALCTLSALVLFWGWFGGRTQTAASANPLMMLMLDRIFARAARRRIRTEDNQPATPGPLSS